MLSFGEFNFGDAFLLVVIPTTLDDSTELRCPSLIQHTQSPKANSRFFRGADSILIL